MAQRGQEGRQEPQDFDAKLVTRSRRVAMSVWSRVLRTKRNCSQSWSKAGSRSSGGLSLALSIDDKNTLPWENQSPEVATDPPRSQCQDGLGCTQWTHQPEALPNVKEKYLRSQHNRFESFSLSTGSTRFPVEARRPDQPSKAPRPINHIRPTHLHFARSSRRKSCSPSMHRLFAWPIRGLRCPGERRRQEDRRPRHYVACPPDSRQQIYEETGRQRLGSPTISRASWLSIVRSGACSDWLPGRLRREKIELDLVAWALVGKWRGTSLPRSDP